MFPTRSLPALLLGASFLAACREAAPPSSVLLVTLDTTRTDAVEPYGSPRRALTPALERLAERGVVFENASTVAPITLPAHASLLTGLYPPRHGIRDNAFAALPGSARTLAEAAREAGVQTAAFVAAAVLRPEFALDQGFDVYDAPRRPETRDTTYVPERPGEEVVEAALAWLGGRDPERRFLLWVHLFEPHAPYQPPRELAAAHGGDPYLGEVAWSDRLLEPLLSTVEALDEPVTVLFVADHGEGRGEHGEETHAYFVYQTTISVPLILARADGRRAGARSRAVVSVVDVAPTLADALGVALPAGIDGRSLWNADPPADRGVYFESYAGYLTFGWSPIAGWRAGDRKYVHSSRPELYDLAADPGESANLLADDTDLRPFLAGIEAVATAPALAPEAPAELDAELLHDIRSLGYVGAGPAGEELPHPLAPVERKSPHAGADELERYLTGSSLFNQGRYADALAVFEALPDASSAALAMRINCLLTLDRKPEAIEPIREHIRRRGGSEEMYVHLATCLAAADRPEEAVEAYELALATRAERPAWFADFVRLLQTTGRRDRARELRERFGTLRRERDG